MQSNCLRSGLEYIFGFPFQTAHYFILVSNFTPNRYGKEIQIILRLFLVIAMYLSRQFQPIESITQPPM